MPIEQFFGRADEQAQLTDDSGRWRTWVQAQPALRQVGSAAALVDVVHDRDRPERANQLLLALVRAGSTDGGVDEAAATFVAALLAPGGNRIIRTLTTLGPEVADIVAGQLWLQVRDYPWRDKPNAVAKNILMDTRRAVLRDYDACTHRRAALVPIPSPDDVDPRDHAMERVIFEAQVPDLALLQVLVWATAWKVLRPKDAAFLWDLVLVEVELRRRDTFIKPLSHGGAGSKRAAAVLADRRGVTMRHVRRQRDLAVSALREASDAFRGDFSIGRAVGAATPTPAPARPPRPLRAVPAHQHTPAGLTRGTNTDTKGHVDA